MANYHFETTVISRSKGRSVTGSVSYICGRTLHDSYKNRTYHNPRKDVLWQNIFLPDHAPPEFRKLQHLCDEIEQAEVRWDARTARQFIASLPNELPSGELVRMFKNSSSAISCPVICVRLPRSTGAAAAMIPPRITPMSTSSSPPGRLERMASVSGRTESTINGSTSISGGSNGHRHKIELTSETGWTSRSAMRALRSRGNATMSPPST